MSRVIVRLPLSITLDGARNLLDELEGPAKRTGDMADPYFVIGQLRAALEMLANSVEDENKRNK